MSTYLLPPPLRRDANRCLVIGEVAQAHDGSLGMAHAFIDAIANAGADAVKFQTHIAAAESTPSEPWRVRFSYQDATRYAYWQRMEFSEEQWHGLKHHAADRGLLFLSSPFSLAAVALLSRVGVAAWKIASGEVQNTPMLAQLAATGLPVLLSTGMSPLNEIDSAVEQIRAAGASLVVLQCTSAYPCPPEQVGLNLLPFFGERYSCAVGLSDHSGMIYAGLAAATLGAQVLEVHVALSREAFGPDVPASLTPQELGQLSAGVRLIGRMVHHPVDKDTLGAELAPMRALFTKSIAVNCDLAAGTVLQHTHLSARKPGTGMPAAQLPAVVGRQLRRAVAAHTLLSVDDLKE